MRRPALALVVVALLAGAVIGYAAAGGPTKAERARDELVRMRDRVRAAELDACRRGVAQGVYRSVDQCLREARTATP